MPSIWPRVPDPLNTVRGLLPCSLINPILDPSHYSRVRLLNPVPRHWCEFVSRVRLSKLGVSDGINSVPSHFNAWPLCCTSEWPSHETGSDQKPKGSDGHRRVGAPVPFSSLFSFFMERVPSHQTISFTFSDPGNLNRRSDIFSLQFQISYWFRY